MRPRYLHRRRPLSEPETFVDLSHAITPGMETYPGLPVPIIEDHLHVRPPRPSTAWGSRSRSASSRCGRNTVPISTPRPSPVCRRPRSHRSGSRQGRRGASDVPRPDAVERIDRHRRGRSRGCPGCRRVDPHRPLTPLVDGHLLRRSPALDHRVSTSTRSRAVWRALASTHSTSTRRRPATVRFDPLLGAQIPIVEHLTGLHHLPPSGFTFTAVPPRLRVPERSRSVFATC